MKHKIYYAKSKQNLIYIKNIFILLKRHWYNKHSIGSIVVCTDIRCYEPIPSTIPIGILRIDNVIFTVSIQSEILI